MRSKISGSNHETHSASPHAASRSCTARVTDDYVHENPWKAVGVAAGVADAVADGLIEATSVALQCLIAAVWVNPEASDADLVFANNRKATHDAIANGRRNEPDLRTVLDARDDVFNPYYRAPSK